MKIKESRMNTIEEYVKNKKMALIYDQMNESIKAHMKS